MHAFPRVHREDTKDRNEAAAAVAADAIRIVVGAVNDLPDAAQARMPEEFVTFAVIAGLFPGIPLSFLLLALRVLQASFGQTSQVPYVNTIFSATWVMSPNACMELLTASPLPPAFTVGESAAWFASSLLEWVNENADGFPAWFWTLLSLAALLPGVPPRMASTDACLDLWALDMSTASQEKHCVEQRKDGVAETFTGSFAGRWSL